MTSFVAMSTVQTLTMRFAMGSSSSLAHNWVRSSLLPVGAVPETTGTGAATNGRIGDVTSRTTGIGVAVWIVTIIATNSGDTADRIVVDSTLKRRLRATDSSRPVHNLLHRENPHAAWTSRTNAKE